MAYTQKPTLKSTDKELLLFIHPQLKEKAKIIQGHSWDGNRGCWVYPRSKEVYDAILLEFGDGLVNELQQDQFVKKKPIDTGNDSLQGEIERLKAENARFSEKIRLYEQKEKKSFELSTPAHEKLQEIERANEGLKLEIVRQKGENANLRERIGLYVESEKRSLELSKSTDERLLETENELNAVKGKLTIRQKDLSEIKRQNLSLSSIIDNLKIDANDINSSNNTVEQAIKDIALTATGKDKNFNNFLSQVRLDASLPILVQSRLEKMLRAVLEISEDDRPYNTSEIIQKSINTCKLSKEAVDLAYTIRNQRNATAHVENEYVYEKTAQARSVLCLCAFALLWPEIPEKSCLLPRINS